MCVSALGPWYCTLNNLETVLLPHHFNSLYYLLLRCCSGIYDCTLLSAAIKMFCGKLKIFLSCIFLYACAVLMTHIYDKLKRFYINSTIFNFWETISWYCILFLLMLNYLLNVKLIYYKICED